MAQISRFIDVTRTYVPVDPNSFPETMHVSGREDAPEQHIPVMAYKGYNFLPTSYGYKSYFGTEQKLNVDALAASVDYIFVYQSTSYQNILVALTDTGIWIKKGTETGAWIQTVPMVTAGVDDSAHFEWTFCIIQNVLYAYRQGQPSFQKFASSVAAGVTISSIVPGFLNMPAQVGIFRASGRLAFWDSDDSIGWSNLDDTSDFTPSLETLAGAIKFSEVHGRIVTIKQHGSGFIIYATKSVLYVAQDTANLYQWAPHIILPNAGIQYPRQVAVGSPDTLHFAYTSEGLKKIMNAQEETIVPEVTDFLKEYRRPVYVTILQGRYLCLELVDDDYLTGHVQFVEEVVPGVTYTFPGGTSGGSFNDDGFTGFPASGSVCNTFGGFNSGGFGGMGQPDIPPDGVPEPDPEKPDPDPKPEKKPEPGIPGTPGNVPIPYKDPPYEPMQPVYTGYFKAAGPRSSNILFGPTPCPTVDPYGVEHNFCPIMADIDHRPDTPKSGADLYIDGKLTIERFTQIQMAMWKSEELSIKEIVQKIIAKAVTVRRTTFVSGSCTTIETIIPEECGLGRYPYTFDVQPRYGYSACEFWLTRWITGAVDIVRIKHVTVTCEPVEEELSLWRVVAHDWGTIGTTDYIYGSIAQALAVAQASYEVAWGSAPGASGRGTYVQGTTLNYSSSGAITAVSIGVTGGGMSYSSITRMVIHPAGFNRTETFTAHNVARPVAIAPIPETASLKLTGWSYNKKDGTKGILPATTCTAPMLVPKRSDGGRSGQNPTDPQFPKEDPVPTYPEDDPEPTEGPGGSPKHIPRGSNSYPPIAANGSMCGSGYTPTTGSTGFPAVTWPDTSVTLPAGSYLLQVGSIAPKYPNFAGALVYDLHLKKWGKMRLPYKQLLDYSPINTTDSGVVLYSAFGILGGALNAEGKISLFDEYPKDSYIAYGKVGYYRLGKTSPEEVTVHFRTPCTGALTIETSLYGRNLAAGFTKTQPFANAVSATLYGAFPGSWSNIVISGNYDINYLEYRGVIKGRR